MEWNCNRGKKLFNKVAIEKLACVNTILILGLFTILVSVFVVHLLYVRDISRSSIVRSEDFGSNVGENEVLISHGFNGHSIDLFQSDLFLEADHEAISSNNEVVEEQYECQGSCSCGESRRSSSFFLRKSYSSVVFAVSSLMAVYLAKKKFKKECDDDFIHECDEDKVTLSVDWCKKHGGRELPDGSHLSIFGPNAKPLWTMKDKIYENDDKIGLDFECRGHCMIALSIYEYEEKGRAEYLEKLIKEAGRPFSVKYDHFGTFERNKCNVLRMEGHTNVEFPEGKLNKIKTRKHGKEFLELQARTQFEKISLRPFCKESSLFDDEDYEYLGDDFEKKIQGQEDHDGGKVGWWCTSYHSFNSFDNVECSLLTEL